jgi:type II secretory ATPase GspE/PulE/Tfp pilus assembly ATPase PilB-like protein
MTSTQPTETKEFSENLLKGQYISADELHAAEEHAKQKGTTLATALVDLKYLTSDLIGQVSAEQIGLTYVEPDMLPTDRAVIQKIDELTARQLRVVFLSESTDAIDVATDTPSPRIGDLLQKIFPGKKITVRYTLPENIDIALKLYEKTLSAKLEELFRLKNVALPEIVAMIFDRAIDAKVSDIHFEPRNDVVAIRFRIDGTLLEVGSIPKASYEKVLNRIKVLSQLPIDEHMRTQDGSLRHVRKEGVVNFRVSIAPTLGGEKIALRVLSSYNGFSIADLGLSPTDQTLIEAAARKPFGMVLTTGPTGSGKTTTLYSFLSARNTPDVNITTIEDPIEYRISGLNQMQVNPLTDLTFARGLRSIVRQDPDIVLVGEIRDKETAEIAVNAALTGRLLFSTFHSNDAATAIPRLIDMGIEPFLLSSTLELIVAQRLARKVCENCKSSYLVSTEEIKKRFPSIAYLFHDQGEITLYKGDGCQACHLTGYRGRIGIFELIVNTPEMQDLIVKKPNRVEILNLAKAQKAHTLFDDGFEKVKLGVTSLEELLRVAQPGGSA